MSSLYSLAITSRFSDPLINRPKMGPPDLNGTSRKWSNLLSLHPISLVFTSYWILKSITWRTTLWKDSSPPLSHGLSFTCALVLMAFDGLSYTFSVTCHQATEGCWRKSHDCGLRRWSSRSHRLLRLSTSFLVSALLQSRQDYFKYSPLSPATSPIPLICSFTLQGK